MKNIIITIALLTSVLCGAYAQEVQKLDDQTITSDSLNAGIEKLVQSAHVAGLAICVLNHNEPVYSHTFGYADEGKTPLRDDQVFYAASLSKAVFAYLVAQLVQDKVIALDKPLVEYLPKPLPDYTFKKWYQGYADLRNDERYKKITARMCLDHTTGFANWRWLEPGRKLRINTDPGTRYHYSGEGLALLQFVIEQVTGKDLETLARERVFVPLQMNSTSYVWQSNWEGNVVLGHDAKGKTYNFKKWTEAGAAGSMCTTFADFTKFFTAVMQHKGLTEATFNEMIRPQIRIRQVKQFGPLALKDSTLNDAVELSYGLGFGVMKTPAGRAFFKEGHDDGWQHFSVGYPDKGIALIIMCNSDNGEGIFKALWKLCIADTYSPWYWENYMPFDGR